MTPTTALLVMETQPTSFGAAVRPPLPQCDGPKLHPFPLHDAPIKWLSRLDFYGDDDTAIDPIDPIDPCDSRPVTYLFKVEIASQLYALKVVCSF